MRFASTGRRVSTSITIAGIVLMSERPFAPPSSHARTYGVIDGTFGASLTRSGSFVAARTAETTS